jgi:outer membrane protein TolC
MKKFSTLTYLLFTFFTIQVSAQETILTEINYGQLEKYIQLAKDSYPKRKIAQAMAESAKTAIPIANLSYLDIFNASYFYRPDQNQDALNPTNPYTVNGFQFGVSLTLGTFLQKPFFVKKAKADYKVAQLQQQDFDLTLATEVKHRYYAYVQAGSQLKISTQAAQDNKNIAENSKYRFEKGEITLDVYNSSRTMVSTANTNKIQSEVNYLVAKDALEEIIGQKIADAK